MASAEISGAATTESKVAAGHDDAYFGVLAGEEVKVSQVTVQPVMQPEIVAQAEPAQILQPQVKEILVENVFMNEMKKATAKGVDTESTES